MKYKLYCIFAKESVDKMSGNRGKLAAQAGHAYLHAYWDATSGDLGRSNSAHELISFQANAYKRSDHAYKIALVVDTVDELKVLQEKYKNICGTALITDAGFTVFNEPTTTCLGLGPISEENIGDDLKAIKTFC